MLEISDEVIFSRSLTPAVYGPIDVGPEVGMIIVFNGGLVRNHETGELFESEPVVGVVEACTDDKVIISMDDGYIGALNKTQFRYVNLVLSRETINTLH